MRRVLLRRSSRRDAAIYADMKEFFIDALKTVAAASPPARCAAYRGF